MLEAALSTSPDVTRLLVGGPRAPPEACVESSPAIAELPSWALCIAISHDRGDESFADDLNMGRGIVSGRVALLLRSTEIPPHRTNDLLPSHSHIPGSVAPFSTPLNLPTLGLLKTFYPLAHCAFRDNHCRESGIGTGTGRDCGLGTRAGTKASATKDSPIGNRD